jgi:DNA-binding winged helix-turn-helix (wHTH) protein
MYVFGAYTLDTQRYELRRAGEPLPLEPKVFDVLTYLVQQCDRLVSKDELLAQVWCGANVGEAALVRCIVAARKAIGDRPETPRIIQTVRGRGYRFVAPVTIAAPATARGASSIAHERGIPFRPLCVRPASAIMVEGPEARLRYIACMKQGPWRLRQAHR